jgi:hypothetical protein
MLGLQGFETVRSDRRLLGLARDEAVPSSNGILA